ncbi:hypothetical protein YPPY34_3538 [Yersinia pestis PY-34]|nr:hypothetical protein YPPY34_3538 [Yersinia pestis PY-34]EIS02573.1 hypothetical protein YPPY48_3588 [Yersinia pestis PY-48]EIT13209.1 hypothetical protein YPPY94_3561 [Yersinia pestis PY-94]
MINMGYDAHKNDLNIKADLIALKYVVQTLVAVANSAHDNRLNQALDILIHEFESNANKNNDNQSIANAIANYLPDEPVIELV